MILANYREKTVLYNLLDEYIAGQLLSEKFCSLITTRCMPMEIDLQSLEDTENETVFVKPLVLVGTKIFHKSDGIMTTDDVYVMFFFAFNYN